MGPTISFVAAYVIEMQVSLPSMIEEPRGCELREKGTWNGVERMAEDSV